MDINFLETKPMPAYIPETELSRRICDVSRALHMAGIHGEENTIMTYESLGIKICCDKQGE